MTHLPSSKLPAALLRFAQAQSPDEVQRQYSVMQRVEAERRGLVLVAFGAAAFFLPLGLCLAMLVIEVVSELVGFRLLKTADPRHKPGDYIAMLACYLVSQISYCALPALIWHQDAPLAKAFAVGSMLVTQMHLATVRTVHLPLAMVGGLTVIGISALSNGWFWLAQGDLTGLFVSSVCVVAASYLIIITMLTVHHLHVEMLEGRTAAQAADQAKSRFLAQMSHELRTPLNAILGMGHAELSSAQTAEQRERLAILVQSAQGLSVMLDDILDLSAVQAGHLPIRPRALDLRAEITSTVAMFRQQAENAGLTLRFSLHELVPHHARLDGQRLRQCLSNILSNAIKYTGQGLISVYAYEHQPGVLAIKVADSGPGVPEALRDKIFEPFFRGELTVPGTGLGMSIARTLARRMGGDLVLMPSVSGAHFLLTLAMEAAGARDLAPVARPALGSLAGIRVLIVDDIATNRLVAATYLRLLEAETVEAAGGAAALDHLAGPDPAPIVLLDMLMPDIDGAETLRRIRALPGAGARTLVVAMSADATEPYRREAHGQRFDGHVTKPLSVESLSAVLLPLALRITPPATPDAG